VGAISALRERGIAVPRDVSVTGFGDLFFAREIMPPLTTVHIPLEEMGGRAMKLALSPAGPPTRVEHIPLEVVERESTAPPPAAARGAWRAHHHALCHAAASHSPWGIALALM